jgi:hypothetical protein
VANTNRPTVKTRNTSVMTGIDKNILTNVTIGGVTYTPAQLKAEFQAQNTAIDRAEALHKQWKDELLVMTATRAKAGALYQLLRSFLIGQFGTKANAILNDFGMNTPKPRGTTKVKTKAAAADKRAATRTARHTLGKVQRKAVKGAPISPAASPPVSPTGVPTTPAAPTKPAT